MLFLILRMRSQQIVSTTSENSQDQLISQQTFAINCASIFLICDNSFGNLSSKRCSISLKRFNFNSDYTGTMSAAYSFKNVAPLLLKGN